MLKKSSMVAKFGSKKLKSGASWSNWEKLVSTVLLKAVLSNTSLYNDIFSELAWALFKFKGVGVNPVSNWLSSIWGSIDILGLLIPNLGEVGRGLFKLLNLDDREFFEFP